jgi:acetyltransferase-like isoleucine patch superfamily enzyme
MNDGFYSRTELLDMGFSRLGKNVSLSRFCFIGDVSRIRFGNNIRIDDYTSLSVSEKGFLELGDNIHIGAGSYLGCAGGITMESYSGLSQGVRIYSASDDFSGEFLTNPTIPDEFRNVRFKPVVIRKHAIIGSGCVILPGVEVGYGVAVGALSLVNRSLSEWSIYSGSPARFVKNRSKLLLDQESAFENKLGS